MDLEPNNNVYKSFRGDFEDLLEQLHHDKETSYAAEDIEKHVHDWWTCCNE